jgi:hypothetical protein
MAPAKDLTAAMLTVLQLFLELRPINLNNFCYQSFLGTSD